MSKIGRKCQKVVKQIRTDHIKIFSRHVCKLDPFMAMEKNYNIEWSSSFKTLCNRQTDMQAGRQTDRLDEQTDRRMDGRIDVWTNG